jgi:hypothetical protein
VKNLALEIKDQLKKRASGRRGKQQHEEENSRVKRRASKRRGK